MKMKDTKICKENAIIIAVCTKKGDALRRKLDEITRLSISAGLNVVKDFYQIIKDFNKATVLGSGKVKEIKDYISNCDEIIDVVIIDYPLSGSQMKIYQKNLGLK